ncbi:MAG: PIN domain-containing protein [Saprospiraceae bacterium]
MKIFVDTNILVDLIADRQPFSKYAVELFTRAETDLVTLYTSSHSIATTHYLLKKYIHEKELREVLIHLLDYITVISVDLSIIKKSLKSNYKDFEDALQIYSAHSVEGIECIVTRNLKDFKGAHIPVYSPDEVVAILIV